MGNIFQESFVVICVLCAISLYALSLSLSSSVVSTLISIFVISSFSSSYHIHPALLMTFEINDCDLIHSFKQAGLEVPHSKS